MYVALSPCTNIYTYSIHIIYIYINLYDRLDFQTNRTRFCSFQITILLFYLFLLFCFFLQQQQHQHHHQKQKHAVPMKYIVMVNAIHHIFDVMVIQNVAMASMKKIVPIQLAPHNPHHRWVYFTLPVSNKLDV